MIELSQRKAFGLLNLIHTYYRELRLPLLNPHTNKYICWIKDLAYDLFMGPQGFQCVTFNDGSAMQV